MESWVSILGEGSQPWSHRLQLYQLRLPISTTEEPRGVLQALPVHWKPSEEWAMQGEPGAPSEGVEPGDPIAVPLLPLSLSAPGPVMCLALRVAMAPAAGVGLCACLC